MNNATADTITLKVAGCHDKELILFRLILSLKVCQTCRPSEGPYNLPSETYNKTNMITVTTPLTRRLTAVTLIT